MDDQCHDRESPQPEQYQQGASEFPEHLITF